MIIEFEREGGFAGIQISIAMDTNDLPNEDRKEIESLVNESNFFSLHSDSDSNTSKLKGAADYYMYKILIKNNETEHMIETTDLTMDNRLHPLVNRLVKEAIKAKKSE
jgi:hypothetical protein